MYKKLLVAVDGSENSMRAAKHAAHIASLSENCSVTIIYVADYSKIQTDVLYESFEQLKEDNRKKVIPAEQIFQNKNIPYSVEILQGVPGQTIVNFANKQQFDILIIGSRGLNALQKMVLGSVSHKVVKGANCPVLVVK